jgi:drug efflux transport system permease protein
MKLLRVGAITYKEWREVLRDRLVLSLSFLLPVILMLVFGYGMTRDVENVPFAVVDYDHSASSREYAHHFIDSRYFRFRGYLAHEREASRMLTDGTVRAVIIIPEQFQWRLLDGRDTQVQTLLDGTFTRSIRTVQGYIEAIHSAAVGELQLEYVAGHLGVPLERARELMQPLKLEVRYLYNEEVRSIWAMAPSLILLILTLVAPLLTALGVVRERETGAIYNVYASTASRAEFLAGKLLPYVLISFVDGFLLWLMVVYQFRVPFRGSPALFLLATLVYVLCASSFGLLLSLVVRTQQAALMITVIVSFLVVNQFSGIFTPVASLTGVNALIAHLLPAMYYNDVIKGVFLKAGTHAAGGGFVTLGWEVGVMAVQAAVVLALAHRRFHKRVAG